MSDTMEGLISDEFMQQFSGSAAANGVTVAIIGALMLLKRLCDRPSRCKSHLHCPCLDVEVVDRDTIRREHAPVTPAYAGPELV